MIPSTSLTLSWQLGKCKFGLAIVVCRVLASSAALPLRRCFHLGKVAYASGRGILVSSMSLGSDRSIGRSTQQQATCPQLSWKQQVALHFHSRPMYILSSQASFKSTQPRLKASSPFPHFLVPTSLRRTSDHLNKTGFLCPLRALVPNLIASFGTLQITAIRRSVLPRIYPRGAV